MNEACRGWQTRLTAWLDGEVSELDAGEVRSHLLRCPGCRAAVQRWNRVREDLELLQPEEPDAEALRRMASRFERGLAAEVRGISQALRLWNLAAALLLLATSGFLLADRVLTPATARAGRVRSIDRALERVLEGPGVADQVPEPEEPEPLVPSRDRPGRR